MFNVGLHAGSGNDNVPVSVKNGDELTILKLGDTRIHLFHNDCVKLISRSHGLDTIYRNDPIPVPEKLV